MLGPFATASRRTPPVLHCHSPGVATVARRLRIDVHDNDDDDNDNAWQRGPLWPHRMGPITCDIITNPTRKYCDYLIWPTRTQIPHYIRQYRPTLLTRASTRPDIVVRQGEPTADVNGYRIKEKILTIYLSVILFSILSWLSGHFDGPYVLWFIFLFYVRTIASFIAITL